jgi:hypothetical protein
MAQVEVTRHLLELFPRLAEVDLAVNGATVADVVAELEKLAPGFAFYVCDELGRVRQHVNIFIGEERICDRRFLTDAVGNDSRVLILQALSGG